MYVILLDSDPVIDFYHLGSGLFTTDQEKAQQYYSHTEAENALCSLDAMLRRLHGESYHLIVREVV